MRQTLERLLSRIPSSRINGTSSQANAQWRGFRTEESDCVWREIWVFFLNQEKLNMDLCAALTTALRESPSDQVYGHSEKASFQNNLPDASSRASVAGKEGNKPARHWIGDGS